MSFYTEAEEKFLTLIGQLPRSAPTKQKEPVMADPTSDATSDPTSDPTSESTPSGNEE